MVPAFVDDVTTPYVQAWVPNLNKLSLAYLETIENQRTSPSLLSDIVDQEAGKELVMDGLSPSQLGLELYLGGKLLINALESMTGEVSRQSFLDRLYAGGVWNISNVLLGPFVMSCSKVGCPLPSNAALDSVYIHTLRKMTQMQIDEYYADWYDDVTLTTAQRYWMDKIVNGTTADRIALAPMSDITISKIRSRIILAGTVYNGVEGSRTIGQRNMFTFDRMLGMRSHDCEFIEIAGYYDHDGTNITEVMQHMTNDNTSLIVNLPEGARTVV